MIPAKVREKPPANVEKRKKMECGGRENSLHMLTMLCKREGGPHLAISISRMTPNPKPSTGSSYVTSYIKTIKDDKNSFSYTVLKRTNSCSYGPDYSAY